MAGASFGCHRAVEQSGLEIVVAAAVEVHAAVEFDVPAGLALAPPGLEQPAILACFADMSGPALAIFEAVSQPGHTSYIGLTIEGEVALHINLTSGRLSNAVAPNHLSSVVIGVSSVLEVQDVKIVGCRGLTADVTMESFSTHMTDTPGAMISSYSEQNMDFDCHKVINQGSGLTNSNDFLARTSSILYCLCCDL